MTIEGTTIVITGASAGIGAAAARQLHRLGAKVVPVGRSPEKTGALARELGVEGHVADFARLDDVRQLAGKLLEQHPRIDVLANNAGGMWTKRVATVDGNELTFQVNVLAPFLLTGLLLDRLRSSQGRMIYTSSAMHTRGRIHFDDLDATKRYRGMTAYGNSKLAAALLVREGARRHPEIGWVDFHPGFVATQFGRDSKMMNVLMKTPITRLISSPDQGASTLVYLAATDEPLRGEYYVNSKRKDEAKAAKDEETAKRLWEIVSERVGVPA